MRRNESAGLLLYRRSRDGIEVFLAHPGGPFWQNRDEGAWTIPKGEPEPGEGLLEAARREFKEETGLTPEGQYRPLGSVRQKAGKVVHAWAIEGDADPTKARSNTMRYRSGSDWRTAPEIDRYGWFDLEEAAKKLNPAQAELLVRLQDLIESLD
jgi:predicted NUDIX family NTP pyrophosphohydrolase